MSRFTYFVAVCLALLAVVSAQVTFSGRTRKGPTIANAGGVALSGDSSVAFVHTISTTASSVYAVGPLPVAASTVANLFFTTTISQQIYYIAASASTSPQYVWILDNQNAQLKSLIYTTGAVLNTSTLVYDFGIANLDLISGMYYQASTNLIFLSFYDHFGGAVNDYIGYLNPYATNPTVSTLYTTNLVAALAGIAVNGAYLYYASVSTSMGSGSAAAIYRVPLTFGGARPATAANTAVAIYNTTQPDVTQTQSINGYVIYPAAMQFSADGATLYFTDIGDQSVQPATTPHAVYALNDIFYQTSGNPLNLTTVVAYQGVQVEVQQSFAMGADGSLYFAATGTQNGFYYNTAPNTSFAGVQPGPPLAQSAAPTAGGAAAVSSSAATRVSSSAAPVSSSAAAVSSSAAAVSSSAARVSSSATPVSSSAAPVSSSATPVSSSAAAVSSSAAAVSSSAAAVSSSAAPAVSSSAAARSSSAAAASSSAAVLPSSSAAAAVSSSAVPAGVSSVGSVSGSGSVAVPAGTVTAGPAATFSDANDALSCLSSNGNATVGFAASNGGNIFVFSLASVPSTLTYTLSTGPGSSGPSFVACQANAAGSFLYLLDTRQSLFVRYNVGANTVQTVATFSDELAGALTALVIDFTSGNAYIGTRSSTQIYIVPIGTLGQTLSQFANGNPTTSDILSLALSTDRTTLYYGFPAPSQGAPGGIASLSISNLLNGNNNPATVFSSASIIYPDALYLNDSATIYFKDGGAFQAKSGPSQSTTQTISAVNLVGTRVLTTLLTTLTQNLPNGLIPVPVSPFFQLAYTTSTNVNFITVINSTGTGAVSAGASSAGAAVSSSAAAAVSSSAARVSSSAAAVSSSAAAVSSSAAAASSSAAAASSSAAATPSSSATVATPSSSAAVAASSSAARVSSSAAAASSSAAAVSSSAAAASSSAAIAASSSAAVSTSSGTRVVGDPMFVGFLRQRFQVHGMDNVVYNILSQASVSINALFVFLESGACPIVDGEPLTNCWSHPGSYFGSLSLQTASGDKLEIVSGAATHGFQAIRFDGEEVQATKGVEGAGAKLSFKVLSSHSMQITIDNYRLVVENSDMFVNLVSIEVLDWQQLASVDQPHGLLGQTWKPSRKARAGQVVAVKDVAEGDVDDYVITSDQLFGTDFVYNKFVAKSQ